MFRLKELRESRKITQTQLAKDLQVSNTTISNWESQTRQPDFDTLVRIADYFDVSVDFLLGRNFKNRLYNQDSYIFRKEQIFPIFHKVLKIDDQYLPKLEGFIDALIDVTKPKL